MQIQKFWRGGGANFLAWTSWRTFNFLNCLENLNTQGPQSVYVYGNFSRFGE